MENLNLYQDIQARTNGDIYIGVVGPVRTGKSTFIKKSTFCFALSICELMSFPLSAKSPEPLCEQKIQPRVPFVPSRLGQVKPPSRDNL